ncbi:MAG: hypothetical protein KJO61_03070 [Deltaproteobacteria bacterium]|nr:hypothetical protein [Deltaproteobacteria bacterium]
MKQKFHIWKNVKEKKLLIQEFAVLTSNFRKQRLPVIQDDDFSLLCEQTYLGDEVKKASSEGKDHLIVLLRNQHFFPIGVYADKIADAVMSMYATKGEHNEDLIFDDKAVLVGDSDEPEILIEVEKKTPVDPKDANNKAKKDDLDNFIKDNPGNSEKSVNSDTGK